MSASKAPVFRSTMFALIKTALAAQVGVEITYGSIPTSGADDFILIRSITKRGDFASLGAGSLKEFLDLDIIISCARGGDDTVASTGQSTQQIASERAWALLALIEARVRTDITLGIAQPFWVIVAKAQEIETTPDESVTGREAEITVTFTAETRI